MKSVSRTMNMPLRRSRQLDAAEELALFEQWRVQGEGRAEILEASLSLVAATARGFGCSSSDRSDLIAEGYLALLTAFERFDPGRGVRFTTYARHWVSAAMKAYLGRSQNALGSRAYARMHARLRHEASLTDAGSRDVSLDAPISADRTTTLLECLATNSLDPDDELERAHRRQLVNAAVTEARETFDAREQVIFDLRFQVDEDDSDDAATLDDAARRLGLSRERVRQLEERVRRKLADRILSALPELGG